ncbi:MAG: UDP-N-acetylmuramyl-tripeptide synthetase [Oligoflexia bacterium]|nr:UDP-N-acetylmuramyl-tripeptide synthetase [Oligoflexia bacterium]
MRKFKDYLRWISLQSEVSVDLLSDIFLHSGRGGHGNIFESKEEIEILKFLNVTDIEWSLNSSKIRSKTMFFYHLRQGDAPFKTLLRRLEQCSLENCNLDIVLTINDNDSEDTIIDNGARTLKQNFPRLKLMIVREEFFLELQSCLLQSLYRINWNQKRLVGITGTNGKTTTTFLAKQIANLLGNRAAALGTLGVSSAENEGFCELESGLTTPPFIELYKTLYRLYEIENHDLCFMEVSSHAISQERIYGMKFDLVAWTSFGRDHLDFHLTMQAYFDCKLSLVSYLKKGEHKFFIPWNENQLQEKISKTSLVSLSHPLEDYGMSWMDEKFPEFLKSEFNKKNFELALQINYFLNFGEDFRDRFLNKFKQQLQLEQNIHKLKAAEGRFAIYKFRDKQDKQGEREKIEKIVVIDYAHTPDALEKICLGIREVFPGKDLVLLFGCGGERDHGKRPLMGEIAQRYANKIYLTSDNPRSEDPDFIISQIRSGISKTSIPIEVIVDRKMAVRSAYSGMDENQVLLLAGKGPEPYLLIKGVKYEYSDLQAVTDAASMDV